jgi:glycosyltransferase involved in cell wall biosynthesis
LRVTLISKACVVGAYQTKLEEIAAQQGVDLTVVVPSYWRESNRRLALERAHTQGYEMIVAPMAFNGNFHLHYYPTLPAILARTRPDVVHMDEEPYNLATYLAVRAADRVGARALFFTWQNLNRRYPPPFRQMENHVYRHVHAAIAGNRDAVDVLRAKGYIGPARVIPQFGVDPNLFCPQQVPRPHATFTVGYAGRLVEQKGLSTLLDALEAWRAPWNLVVCGSGGPLRAELQARLAGRGLLERVRFHDHVPSEDMPRHLRMMDVLVLPSLTRPNWKEQFGRVLIEAMACGVPVVGSDSGEIPHVIGNGGLVFAEGDATALRDALESLRVDPVCRARLGRRGRNRVLAHYTQARIAAETVALYRDMLVAPAVGAE